ncbi:hypothetical protein ABZ923_37330 [Streptomyces sp. NPDC046881]|uniref:hypothetical protein n=1 Tax=Streptomyces sp. NPDC046881 TaxID=3155374 RepID=UPI0033F2372D
MSTRGVVAPGVQVCSLKVDTPQSIPSSASYTIVRFPYGAAEPTDRFEMHQALQPDGSTVTNYATDDRSGLIRPSRAGWGSLYALIQWEAPTATSGTVTEYRDQFVRDPLGETATPNDTTATDHRAATPGGQFWTKSWGIFVTPDVPLALRVTHNGTVGPLLMTLAEFKLVIHPAA